jgi:hypothetical protein
MPTPQHPHHDSPLWACSARTANSRLRAHGPLPGPHDDWGPDASGMGPVLTFEGATNNKRFETYVRKVLLPSLRPHDVVVSDNLSPHHRPLSTRSFAAARLSSSFCRPTAPTSTPLSLAG